MIGICVIVDLVYYAKLLHFKIVEYQQTLQLAVAVRNDETREDNENPPCVHIIGLNNITYNPEVISETTLIVMYILGILIYSPYMYIVLYNQGDSGIPWLSEFKLFFCDLLQHVACSLFGPIILYAKSTHMRKFLHQRVKNFYNQNNIIP